jgi:pyruvate formate lyase activating enzyme
MHTKVLEYLKSKQDEKYKIFTSKLLPKNVELLGVRIPIIRKYAKQLIKENLSDKYLEISLDKLQYQDELFLYSILLANKVDYEFRTTVVKQLHNKEDFEIIGQMIQGAKNYFIQRFQKNESVIDKKLSAPDKEELIEYLTVVKKYVPNAMLRGID